MDTTIEWQLAMDEALVPTTQRLKIRRSNFRLLSDIKSKELTLQLVYDVLRICPFFKAFLIIADVPKIYMHEFWATTTVHYHSIRFKMDNKKHILVLELFRDILHICSRVHGQSFAKTPFEEEILAFIHFIGHSVAIRTLTNSNTKIKSRAMRCTIPDSQRLSFITLCQRILRFLGETRNCKAYKEYYAIATREAVPKRNASVKGTISSSDTSITPPTAAASPRLTASAKGKQTAKASKDKSLSALFKVAMTEAQQLKLVTKRSMQQMHISQPSGLGDDNEEQDDDGDEEDEGYDGEEGNGDDDDEDDDGEEGDDDVDQEVVRDDDKDDDEECVSRDFIKVMVI
nr:hypothetical protein [Tanacetum cinerariifolium]